MAIIINNISDFISNLVPGEEYDIQSDLVFTSTQNIPSNFKINGNGHTFTFNGPGAIDFLSGTNVSGVLIENINLISNYVRHSVRFYISSEIELNNINIDGNNTSNYGITLHTVQNSKVEDCDIKNNTVDGILLTSELKYPTLSENISVNNCSCTENSRSGMSINLGRNILVNKGNYSNNGGSNPQTGINIENDRDWFFLGIQNIEISSVVCKANKGTGIKVSQTGKTANIVISNCNISNNADGITANGSYIGIEGNKIIDNNTSGIAVKRSFTNSGFNYSDETTIQNNVIEGGSVGIDYRGNNAVIFNNIIRRPSKVGILGEQLGANNRRPNDYTKVRIEKNTIDGAHNSASTISIAAINDNLDECIIEDNEIRNVKGMGIKIGEGKTFMRANKLQNIDDFPIQIGASCKRNIDFLYNNVEVKNTSAIDMHGQVNMYVDRNDFIGALPISTPYVKYRIAILKSNNDNIFPAGTSNHFST